MLVINRYTCPIHGKVSIQAHNIKADGTIKSYGKMSIDDIDIFENHQNVIVCDVVRAANLKDINTMYGSQLHTLKLKSGGNDENLQ